MNIPAACGEQGSDVNERFNPLQLSMAELGLWC
jgi:hypothetical protein